MMRFQSLILLFIRLYNMRREASWLLAGIMFWLLGAKGVGISDQLSHLLFMKLKIFHEVLGFYCMKYMPVIGHM